MSFIQKVKNRVESIGDETVKEVDYMGETKKPEPKPPKEKKEKPKKEIKINPPKFKRPEMPKLPKKKEEEPEIEHDFNNDLLDDDDYEYEYEEEYNDDEIVENNEPVITYDHKEVIETNIEEKPYSYDDPVEAEEVNKEIIEKDFVEKDVTENYKEILDKLKISEQVVVPDNVLLEEDCKKIEFNYQSPYGYDITQVKEFSRVSGDSLKELTNLIKKRNKEIVKIAKEASILNSKIEHTAELKETLKSIQISHIEELKDKNSIIAELKTSINNLRKDLLVKNQTLEKVKKAKIIDSNKYKTELKNRDSTISKCENIIQELKKEKYDIEKENAEMMEALKILMLQKEEGIAKEKAIIEEQKKKAKEKEQNILEQIKQAEKDDDPEFISAMDKIKNIITDHDLNSELGIVNEKDDVIDLTNDDLDIFVSAEEKMAHSNYNTNEEPISVETIKNHNNDTDNVNIVDTVSNDVQEYINNLDSNSEDSNSDVDYNNSVENEPSEEDHIKSIIASLYDSEDDNDTSKENDVDDTVNYDPSVLNEIIDAVDDSDDEENMYDTIDEEGENEIIVDDSNISSILDELEEEDMTVSSDDNVGVESTIVVDPDIINEIMEEVSLDDNTSDDSENSDNSIFDEVDNEESDNSDDSNEDILEYEDENIEVSTTILDDLLDDESDDDLDNSDLTNNSEPIDSVLNNDIDYHEEDSNDEELEDGSISDNIDQTAKFSDSDGVYYDDSVLDNKMSLFTDSSDDDFSQYYDDEDDENSVEELEFLENANNYSDEEYVDIDMLNDIIKDNK